MEKKGPCFAVLKAFRVVFATLFLFLIFVPFMAFSFSYVILFWPLLAIVSLIQSPLLREDLTGFENFIRVLLAAVFGPFVFIWILAPFRAVYVPLVHMFDYGETERATWLLASYKYLGWLDCILGFGGILFYLAVGALSLKAVRKQLTIIENIPSSTVRAASAGLVELRGRAEPAPPFLQRKKDYTFPEFNAGENPEKPVLVKGSRSGALIYKSRPDGPSDENLTPWSRFYLADETGRILVDPTGASLWDGESALGWKPIRTVYLPADDSGRLGLYAGDSVYLLGNAQVNAAAPSGSSGPERLIVQPLLNLGKFGFLRRIFFLQIKKGDRDFPNLFFLSRQEEQMVKTVLKSAMKNIVFLSALGSFFSAGLFLMNIHWFEAFMNGDRHMIIAELVKKIPEMIKSLF